MHMYIRWAKKNVLKIRLHVTKIVRKTLQKSFYIF